MTSQNFYTSFAALRGCTLRRVFALFVIGYILGCPWGRFELRRSFLRPWGRSLAAIIPAVGRWVFRAVGCAVAVAAFVGLWWLLWALSPALGIPM